MLNNFYWLATLKALTLSMTIPVPRKINSEIPILINATNIGLTLSGISRYSLALSRYFLNNWDYPFQLAVNEDGMTHFQDFKGDKRIITCPAWISPNLGFKGNFLRFLWANKICMGSCPGIIFNTSQMEGCLFGEKQIIAVHDCIPLIFPQYHKKQYLYFRFYLPLVLKRAVKIITFSNFTKNNLIENYKISENKISVIYHGVESTPLQVQSTPDKEPYLLSVGRPSPTKNFEGLIKALEILITQYKLDIKLVLTCNKSDINFPTKNELVNNIHFVGYVSDEELKSLFKNALLFVWPSLYEGFGFPPLEAMLAGCPTAISKTSCLPEIYKDASVYFNPENPEEIAQAINQVLLNKQLRTSLIQKGFKRAQQYTWEISCKAHIEILEDLIK